MAAWVKGKVSSQHVIVSVVAKKTLALVEAATSASTFLASPLVLAQLSPATANCAVRDRPKSAKPPTFEMVLKMSYAISSGETVQQRCLAGFFTCLAMCSGRCMDTQRTKNIKLYPDSLSGESRMKGQFHWTKWFCDRLGLVKEQCVASWLDHLWTCNLPGPDLLLLSFNTTLTA